MNSATRFVLVLIAMSAVADAVGEADPQSDRRAARWAEIKRHDDIWDHARALGPRRRDLPLRYLNISDEEVREVQSAAAEVVPRAIVNISGVVTGCPCEDGEDCKDQVWIVAYRPDKSTGLMLSRIDNRWVIGPVQQWWLRYEKLQANRGTFRTYEAFERAEYELIESFPVCEAPLPIPKEVLPPNVRP